MIHEEHKFIFIHIPKTGGTSIESFFYPDSAERIRLLDGLSPHQLDNKVHFKPEHLLLENPGLKLDNYFKFTFVRNPWSRVVSSYKHTLRPIRKDLREFLDLPEHFEFNTFVRQLSSLKKLHPHYDEQFTFLTDGIKENVIDFVGRFENLQQDFAKVCDLIGIPRQKLPHENKGKHKHYTEYYDKETEAIIAEKYAKDIDCFGYSFGE